MDLTVRPSYWGHPFLLFGLIMFTGMGIAQGGGGGFIMVLLFGGFFGALLLFSVKGQKYIFEDGLLKIKHWTGTSDSLRLADVQKVSVYVRSFGSGDVILHTSSGKTKIKKISQAQALADEIDKQR